MHIQIDWYSYSSLIHSWSSLIIIITVLVTKVVIITSKWKAFETLAVQFSRSVLYWCVVNYPNETHGFRLGAKDSDAVEACFSSSEIQHGLNNQFEPVVTGWIQRELNAGGCGWEAQPQGRGQGHRQRQQKGYTEIRRYDTVCGGRMGWGGVGWCAWQERRVGRWKKVTMSWLQ